MSSKEDRIKARIVQISKSACIGEPVSESFVVEDGFFVLTIKKTNGEINKRTLEIFGVPADAIVTLREKDAVFSWESHADTIFQPGGILNEAFGEAYELRDAQLFGARLVQRAIEMKEQVVIEAPTGTGKSMLSLAVAVKMGLTVVISTSNKALQSQLYFKDAPFLLKTLNPQGKVVLVQGKKNYICRRDAYIGGRTFENGEFQYEKAVDLGSPDPELNAEYREWISSTVTGNLTDAPFELTDKQKRGLVVPENCDARDCEHVDSCFYYEMKRKRQSAQIVICNHALLALDTLYPNAGILPHTQILVVDEAHKLTSFVRNALGKEFLFHRLIDNVLSIFDTFGEGKARGLNGITMSEIRRQLKALESSLKKICRNRNERDISMLSREFDTSVSDSLKIAAEGVWGEGEAVEEREREMKKAADQLRSAADNLRRFCTYDEDDVRWLSFEKNPYSGRYEFDENTKCNMQPLDISWVVRQIAGVSVSLDVPETKEHDITRCHRCNRELTSDTVHVLNGYPYGPKCIGHVDPVGDAEIVSLADWMENPSEPEVEVATRSERSNRATVFQSATLSVGGKFDKLFREWGVKAKTAFIADSPFPFDENCRMLIPAGTTPAKRDFDEIVEFMTGQIRDLVRASSGGAFVLFTANARLHACKSALRDEFETIGYEVLVQGEMGKQKIVERFRENPHCVLFATRTFFEGVDIVGDNLRMVILDAMPFTPPSPVVTAIETKYREDLRAVNGLSAEQAKWSAFNNLAVVEMIIDFKQAFGRLIRTNNDRGVFAILDTAARTSRYGRKAVAELPSMKSVHSAHEIADMFEQFDINGGQSEADAWADFMTA